MCRGNGGCCGSAISRGCIPPGREMAMSNIQVTHDSSPSNARSESCIAINPNNPMQIVCASKKFSDIQNYIFTLATAFSTDGGFSWREPHDDSSSTRQFFRTRRSPGTTREIFFCPASLPTIRRTSSAWTHTNLLTAARTGPVRLAFTAARATIRTGPPATTTHRARFMAAFMSRGTTRPP